VNGILSGASHFLGSSDLSQPQFWVAVAEIIWINILLSGDNAIVIALACRSLPAKQRLGGMVIGTAVALLMRIAFASIVSTLMLFPYIKIIGGAALLWIAVKLLAPAKHEDGGASAATDSMWRAIQLIALADIVMSLDNVIAVAAAANGNYALLVFGLGVSIPAIVAGATIVMAILNYFPMLMWAGAALLGWIAGDVMATDPIVIENTDALGHDGHENIRLASSFLGAIGTLLGGFLIRGRQVKDTV
jgi:YjbE family integral membrane protein